MIKNIFVNWQTSAPGVLAIVTGAVTMVSMAFNHTLTSALAISCIMGILTGVGLLFSQDHNQGAKAHAESQAQIAELQKRSDETPIAIETGDTRILKQVPITPVTIPSPMTK